MLGLAAPAPELAYTFGLGLLAALNPCGFPLLAVYLESFVGGSATSSRSSRLQRAVLAAGGSTIGVVAVFGILGTVVELGWAGAMANATAAARIVMVVLGVAMALGGLAVLFGKHLRLALPEVRFGVGLDRPWSMALFGVSYGIASLGCSLPLFVSGVATTFTNHGAARGTEAVISYGLGMGVLLGALAVGVALVGDLARRPLRRLSRYVERFGAAVLLLVGLYVTSYYLTEIFRPGAQSSGEGFVTFVQAGVSSLVGGHVRLSGALLGAVVVAGLLAAGLSWGRSVGAERQVAPLSEKRELVGAAGRSR